MVGFTTEPTYVVDDVIAEYTALTVKEMGGLGEPAKAEGAIGMEETSANLMVVRTIYYNMQGMQLPESTTASLIRVDVLENGQQIATKMIR